MIRLEHPEFLLLLLLIVPIVLLAWRSRGFEGPIRWWVSLALRALVVLTLVGSLTEPAITRRSDGVATAFVLDRSASIPPQLLADSRRFIETLVAAKANDEDQFALVTAADGAEISTPPTAAGAPSTDEFSGSREVSDLAAGVRRAVSILPPEMMKRVVLVSDGNENAGSLLAEAEHAAARGIPIDVVPIDFVSENEVLVESLRAPSRARPGQTVDLRLAIRSQRPSSGTVFLREGGQLVDLDPATPGKGLPVELEPGVRTIVLPFPVDDAGAHRFEAVFEPSDLAQDRVLENNVGSAVTFVEGPSRVLVIDPSGGTESAPLVSALTQASIPAVVLDPSEVPADSAVLSGFDAIVCVNLPRWKVDGELDRLLRVYVHDVGGGLLMLGGPDALGAGGWISSDLAEALPVDLDPPATRAYLRGSVAIVLDSSGSMASPAMGAFAHKQAMANESAAAGVRSMSHLDEVCVIAFSGMPELVVPRQAVGRDSSVERRIRGITSGGGTNLHAAMRMAIEELRASGAGTKHMIVLTDGMTVGAPETGFELAEIARQLGITVSAVGIEEGAQDPNLKRIAEIAGGRFHPVTDLKGARELPEIFIREFSEFGRRMTIEGDFQPVLLAGTSGPLRGLSGVPRIGGYTVTVPRAGLAELHIVQPSADATDPIFASWNHGLGRAAVFTSDAGARWATAWPNWAEYRAFWEQTIRWLMRPSAPANAVARTRIDGDRAVVELEVTRADGGFDLVTQPDGALVAPDGTLRALPLEQVGAGRWRGEFDIADAGTYLASFALSEDEMGRRTSVFTAVDAPYSREYRTTGANRSLLEQVAARTGGRVIELDSPAQSIDAFLRTGTATPLMSRGLWDLLAMLAALLFLFDAAARRIIFDWEGARPSARTGAGPSALAAIERIRGRRNRDANGAERSGTVPERSGMRPERSGMVPERSGMVPERSGMRPERSGTTNATGVTDTDRTPGGGVRGAERSTPRASGDPQIDDESTASRLLRAKQRASEPRDGERGH